MPYPSGTYVTQILDAYTRAELEQFYSLLQGYLSVEHKDSGAHANVTADSVTVSSDSETGATGQISANGATHTLGEFVFRSGPSFVNELITVGGATNGWKFGRRNLSGMFSVSAQGFALFDLSKDSTSPVFDIGHYSAGDYFLLVPRTAGGKDFALGYKDGTSSDRIKYLAVQDGVYEKGRTAAAAYWEDYTPTWASTGVAPALGNGALVGRKMQIGNTAFFEIALFAGSTTTYGTGAWLFALPVSKRSDNFVTIGQMNWFAQDASTGNVYVGNGAYNTTQVEPISPGSPAAAVTNVAPFAWANGDTLILTGSYEIA